VSDESLFREVDEEVRQEQFKKLWSKYGSVFTALAIGVVAVVAGFKGWQYWQVKQSEAAAESFFAAAALSGEGKHAEAQKLLSGIGHAGYAMLAKFRLAADLATEGKAQDAVKLYDQLAADTAVEAPLRDLARVRAGYLLVDSAAPADLLKKLGDLDRESNPWRHPVREIAGLSAYRTGDYRMADKYMNTILADRETPAGLRQRAQMMEQLLTPLLDKPAAP
jgi:hypothetical protein